MKHPKQSILSKDGISYLIPFVLITSCLFEIIKCEISYILHFVASIYGIVKREFFIKKR